MGEPPSTPPGQAPQDVHIVSVAPLAFTNCLPLCTQSFVSLHGFQPPTFAGVWRTDGFPTEEEAKFFDDGVSSAFDKRELAVAMDVLKRNAEREVSDARLLEECVPARAALGPGICRLVLHGMCLPGACLHISRGPLAKWSPPVHEHSPELCGELPME